MTSWGLQRVVENEAGDLFIVGSSTTASGKLAMAIWKLTPSGDIATDFGSPGTLGVFLTSGAAGGSNDSGYDLALLPGAGIVVAGESQDTNGFSSAAVWKIR